MTRPQPRNRHAPTSAGGCCPEEVDAKGGRDALVRVGLSRPRRDVLGETDDGMQRVRSAISARSGITRIHSVPVDAHPMLCLHYDPERLAAARAARLARLAGAAVTSQRWLTHFVRQAFASEEATARLVATDRRPSGRRASAPLEEPRQ